MCDQTEVQYSPGDVVWVKLGPVWWPGQVQDYDKLPEEITHDLRKKPIAVVKFFQEDSYEYVKNLNQIYHYNCRKKEEFIKKGLDMVRSSNTREVPSNMSMFPNDVVMAEHITGGDPNIMESETFAPEQKANYSELFGTTKKSSGKKGKADSLKKEFRRHSESPIRNSRISMTNLPATIPRPITHPRFITKALEGKSDHEVRIRCQISIPKDNEDSCDVNADKKKYKCHLCDFQSARLNVIVLHNKSHNSGFLEVQNAPKAKLKSKDRERLSLGPISVSEQTPTTFTSRGRVKSLPKKLLDYTDEPPPKMLKEKSYSKHSKEEPLESPKEDLVEKTPKKQKFISEKVAAKRPLFGKRKSAKEKAELAAKLKQENEAMKETLLKDWDDDDVNEEEVELERLKQALESTTTSSLEEEVDSPPKENKTSTEEKGVGKSKENSPKGDSNSDKSVQKSDDVKSKVFEFDDSEDNVPVNINFRLKNKQEKFTDDKFKKPRPPKPLGRPKSKTTPPIPPPPLFSEKKEEDKETADLTEAFNALLEETSVPVLPEIPTTSVNLSTPFSDQTSDISSSTDLIEAPDVSGDITSKVILDDPIKESTQINCDLQMECTSSDNEEINTSERVDSNNEEVLKIDENQKNMMEVSAAPSAETDYEVISSGDATTTSESLNLPPIPTTDMSIGEDSTTTEITSTCDGSKALNEEKEVKLLANDVLMSAKIEDKTDYIAVDSVKSESEGGAIVTDENATCNDSNSNCLGNSNDKESLFELTSKILKEDLQIQKSEVEIESEKQCESSTFDVKNDLNLSGSKSLDTDLIYESVVSNEVNEETKNIIRTGVVQEEIVEDINSEQKFEDKADDSTPELNISEQLQDVITHQNSKVQVIVPINSDSNGSTTHTSSQQIENQTMTQSLQDMELDINSMPVIIGGEDFIHPEPSKPNLIPIQPKYSESIVISPKVNSTPSNKKESVIVHLNEPSSSNQNVQSVISLPNKGGKGGNRSSRTTKTTSKTIKLSASALKNLGSLQKGGNQQVLILKTASSKDSQDKGSLQKTQGPLNLIQHGNKILIVNNPQMSGQNKIKLNPQQQQLLTGGKLAPGTRVFTSKVVATTTPSSKETNKTSTTRSSSKPTQKLVISKGGLLSNVSKSVIINSSPSSKLISAVSGLQNITSSKGQTIVTHNLLSSKSGLILPCSSQSVTSGSKTATIITPQSFPSSKGMILTPIASKGGQIISGNQKLKIVSSKAPLSGTKFVVQSSPGKATNVDAQPKSQQIKLISGLRGQTAGNTILIQTSQGLVAKSISPSAVSVAATKSTSLTTTPKTAASSPAKIRLSSAASHPPIIVQQPQPNTAVQQNVQPTVNVQPATAVKKVTVQKVRQSPNILQKPQRKSTPRGSRGTGSRSKTQPAPAVSEPILLSKSANLPVIAQPSLVQAQIPQNSDGLLYLTIDDSGNYRQLDSKSLLTLEGNPIDAPRTIYIPASSQPQDVGNVFLTIDDAGMTQLVNITQPTPTSSFNEENPAPAQDILAKALANTQVFQQETIIPDVDVTSALSSSVDSSGLPSASFAEQAQYPAPSLSHSVQETSLTLTQPIMTPLEVPSNVPPSLGQISTLPSNYITANLINSKQKNIHPSMPLLTEELTSQTRGEPVYLLDSSNNIIPLTSGSQTSFQLTLDDNMVTMSSGTSSSVLPQTYQVVSSDLLTSQLITTSETNTFTEGGNSVDSQEKVAGNINFNVLQETSKISSEETLTSQHSGILREALESPQNFKSEHFLNSVEIAQSGNHANSGQVSKIDEQSCRVDNSESVDTHPEQVTDEKLSNEDIDHNSLVEEAKHSLKRSLGEEQRVTSSSDTQDGLKKIKLEER